EQNGRYEVLGFVGESHSPREDGRNNRKGSKRGSKDEVKRKDRIEKLVKINGKRAEASIRVSLSMNIISMKYIKEKGLIWKLRTIKSLETIFVISDENDVDEDHLMKRGNNDRKETNNDRASVNGFRNEKEEQPDYKREGNMVHRDIRDNGNYNSLECDQGTEKISQKYLNEVDWTVISNHVEKLQGRNGPIPNKSKEDLGD
ncbi:39041_t:CDS:2, partial [Gigaspora margarita]